MSIRLLLASNYALARDGIRLLLAQSGEIKLVGEAECVAQAPQKFDELQPDVALLDVCVTGAPDGLQAVSRIVRSSPDACALVLSNNEDVSYARSMLALGARGYVLQHSSATELFAAIRTAAAGKQFIDSRLSTALGGTHNGHKPSKLPSLTQREEEVVSCLARGYTNSQTASRLNLTLRTIETYRARIYRKLHLQNRAELVHYAIAHGLLG